MQQIKKTISIILLVLLATLCGCGGVNATSAKLDIKETDIDRDAMPMEESIQDEAEEFDYKSVEMIPVISSYIEKIGYAGEQEILLIRFRNDGSLYAYYQVSDAVYHELMTAESIGSYFANSIRDIYKYDRLESGEGYEAEQLYHETTPDKATYVLNTNKLTFHDKSCRYADPDKYEVAYVSDSKEDLEKIGGHPCKVCKPE